MREVAEITPRPLPRRHSRNETLWNVGSLRLDARELDHLAPFLGFGLRAPRVAALERELNELHRVEEALVAAAIAVSQPVHRSPSAPPVAVLGVRVADKVSRTA